MTAFESLVKVAKLDQAYAQKVFFTEYVLPRLKESYGPNAPIHLLTKTVKEAYIKKAICAVYGVKDVKAMSVKEMEQFNFIFPVFKIES